MADDLPWRRRVDTTKAATAPDAPTCYRCGRPGFVDWKDVRTVADPGPVWCEGESYCLTPGCADEDGSRRLRPLTPEDLRRRADEAFLWRHKALAEDR